MSLQELIYSMKCGEEFDLQLKDLRIFLQPEYESLKEDCNEGASEYTRTIIWIEDGEDSKELFRGTTEEVINYKFLGKYTFKDHMELFSIPTWWI